MSLSNSIRPLCTIIALLMSFVASSAKASVIASEGLMDANATLVNFDNLSIGSTTINAGIARISSNGASVVPVPEILANPSVGVSGNLYGFGVYNFYVDFSQPVSQVGLAIVDPNFAGDTLRILNSNGDVLESIVAPNAPFELRPANTPNWSVFLGFTRSSADISRLELIYGNGVVNGQATGDWQGIDNLKFSQVSSVPEASSSAMILAGLSCLGVALRRKRL